MGADELTAKQFQESGGVGDWRWLAFGASAWFDAPSHTAGAALVRKVAELAVEAGWLPDIDLRASGVHVRLPVADVALARAISAAARDLGLTADPAAVQAMQVTIDTLDKSAVLPFWQTVLGYEQVGDEDLVDSLRRDPAIWFQQQDQPRPLRNRIHLDVARPVPDAAWKEAVEAAGGRRVSDRDYHRGDADGNEVDLISMAPVEELGDATVPSDWHVPFVGTVFYPITSPPQAAELATVVAELADKSGLPMLIDLRPAGVTLDTGKDQNEDERFLELARQIQAAARELGLSADPTPLRFVQLGIDAVDIPTVREFWKTVLGYDYDPRPWVTDIYDPRRLNPPLFFQQITEPDDDRRRRQRNRIHVDVFVPDDQAQARVSAALEAGGRVVYDAEAPAWWTIADPEGNEVDIAVSVGRAELRQAGPPSPGP